MLALLMFLHGEVAGIPISLFFFGFTGIIMTLYFSNGRPLKPNAVGLLWRLALILAWVSLVFGLILLSIGIKEAIA